MIYIFFNSLKMFSFRIKLERLKFLSLLIKSAFQLRVNPHTTFLMLTILFWKRKHWLKENFATDIIFIEDCCLKVAQRQEIENRAKTRKKRRFTFTTSWVPRKPCCTKWWCRCFQWQNRLVEKEYRSTRKSQTVLERHVEKKNFATDSRWLKHQLL